jgi:hypothetical protein
MPAGAVRRRRRAFGSVATDTVLGAVLAGVGAAGADLAVPFAAEAGLVATFAGALGAGLAVAFAGFAGLGTVLPGAAFAFAGAGFADFGLVLDVLLVGAGFRRLALAEFIGPASPGDSMEPGGTGAFPRAADPGLL